MQARAARLRSQHQLFLRLRLLLPKPSIYVSPRGKTGVWDMLGVRRLQCVQTGSTRAHERHAAGLEAASRAGRASMDPLPENTVEAPPNYSIRG